MITTFHAITVFGAGDPRMLSGGISEALVTTQLGLSVAVPLLVLHHFLERRVDTLLADMEEKGAALAVVLQGAGDSEMADAAESPAPRRSRAARAV
jgi:biopolymer transport protein ExbB